MSVLYDSRTGHLELWDGDTLIFQHDRVRPMEALKLAVDARRETVRARQR